MPTRPDRPAATAERCKILIVGAGLAGLSAAYHLRQRGVKDVVLVEALHEPGGWATTDWDGPWGSDRGIHVLYFRDEEMRAWAEELVGGTWRRYDKRALIDSAGVRTPFPYHAHLHGRPPQVVFECLKGVWDAMQLARSAAEPPVTFADWIARTQGAGVARHFMEPYNLKVWTVPPSEMGWDWMGDFIPLPDPAAILRGALFPAADAVGLNAHFYYAPGGASTLSRGLAARSGPIRFNHRLAGLDAREHVAWFEDGSAIRYEQLVSTLPLSTLGRMLLPLPAAEHEALHRLEAVDLVLVDVGFKDAPREDAHWIYFSDPDVLAYRAHVIHALSPEMMPKGHGLYCLEISHSHHRPLPAGDLKRRVVDDLVRTGWLTSADQVVHLRERRFANSYVLPRVGFKQDSARLRAHARAFDIFSIGRYGEWKYCNQEDALVDGRRAARELVAAPGSVAAART